MKKTLTIAGSDSSGGAGVQGDLKAFWDFGVHGAAAITALTAQNTQGVREILEVPPAFVAAQIESVAADMGADALKTGMLLNAPVVEAVAAAIARLGLRNLVVDPVMTATAGKSLLDEEGRLALAEKLLPLAVVATPNLAEAEVLAGMPVRSVEEMEEAARRIKKRGCPFVVVTGGHLEKSSEAVDVVYDGRRHTRLKAPFVGGRSVHGTGCAFSAAAAAGLALGMEPLDAVRRAKEYVTRVIAARVAVGKGAPVPGPLSGPPRVEES